ncbi:MAG: AAA family ATPase [Chitinophagaceae bacterium]|nr:AAA family ATPase [Chitinophagaceae bacterium]
MAKYFIKSISIEGFRGINNQGSPLLINFQSDGVTSIFGENGKGKSSIYESFLFSILGRIVRFDDYHGDIKDKGTIKNIFHSTDGGIKIEFIDNSNTVTDIKVNINSTGERSITSTSISNPELFLATLCSSLNFLDYKSFEKIMLTSSEETGKLFSNLVGFGNFIKIKDKLDKISRTQNINTDFGKSLKETVIKTNDQKISDTLIDIQKRFKEINIDKQINKANDTFNYIKSFLKKQYSVSLKGSIYKSTIDFDQLVKAKIGSAYESNVSKLNTQETLFNDISKLFKNISNLKQIRINSLMSKLKAAYSELTTEDDIVLGKLFDDAIKSYDVVSGFDKNTCILCQSENLGSTKGSFYQQISTKSNIV